MNETSVSEEQLDTLERGCEGVTPGPWFAEINERSVWVGTPKGNGRFQKCDDVFFGHDLTDVKPEYASVDIARAAHIARCDPDTIRSLVAEVRTARRASPAPGGEPTTLRDDDPDSLIYNLQIARIGRPYRYYQGDLYGSHADYPDAQFRDYGLARAAATIFNNAGELEAALRAALADRPAIGVEGWLETAAAKAIATPYVDEGEDYPVVAKARRITDAVVTAASYRDAYLAVEKLLDPAIVPAPPVPAQGPVEGAK